MRTTTKKTKTIERAILLRSGKYWTVKRNKRYGPFETIEAARLERDRIETEQAPKPQGGPFADFVRKYYYPHYLDKMKSNTRYVWRGVYESCIIPYFADKKINDITLLDVMEFQQHLVKQKLEAITINMRISILKNVFNAAKELEFIKNNPVEGLKPLKVNAKDRIVLTELEILKIVNSIDHPFKYAIALAGLAGARVGETIAFQWDDFDLGEHGKISFKRQINRQHEIAELKTEGSKLELPMIKPLTQLLREYKEKCLDPVWLFQGKVLNYFEKLRNVNGVVLYKYHRKPLPWRKYEYNEGQSISQFWRKNREAFGFPTVRFHDLRHTFATNMITRCKNIKTAQKLCRHASINTTLEIYAHVHPEQLEEVWDWDF